ncbi:MAG: hypothetical protein ACUVRH_02365 [Candidatus Bipolaricaulia bacterium]
MHIRSLTLLVVGLLLLLGWGGLALAQEGPSQAELEMILKQTKAEEAIVNLGRVLIGEGVMDRQVLTLGVTLKIAAELEEYAGLKVEKWFKDRLGRELSKAELNWLDLVKASLKNSQPDLYGSLQAALKSLKAKPPAQPGSSEELAPILASLQGLNQRLTNLENQVASLAQQGQKAASAEELAALKLEVEGLKASLPNPKALTEPLPQMADLQGKIESLDRSLSGQRGLMIFLIVLVLLLLAWLVFLRTREMARMS